jgi:hypothetical protein
VHVVLVRGGRITGGDVWSPAEPCCLSPERVEREEMGKKLAAVGPPIWDEDPPSGGHRSGSHPPSFLSILSTPPSLAGAFHFQKWQNYW